jgi:hypothetical protein
MDVVLKWLPVALITKIRLVYTISPNSHVDGLKPLVDPCQLMAPGVLVGDLTAKRKRIAGAYDAQLPRGNLTVIVGFCSK